MNLDVSCPLASALAMRMREARDELTAEWLVRIVERVSLSPARVFPTADLLDHVPLLVDGIADFLEDPSESVAADAPVIAKAMELGSLRYRQGFDESEVLKEFEILGDILLAFMAHESDLIDEPCTRGELMLCAQRVHRALSIVHMAAVTQFLGLLRRQVSEREDRLQAFNRALTHEFRNTIGAASGAAQLLDLETLHADELVRMHGVIKRNLASMRIILENLVELSLLSHAEHPRRAIRFPPAMTSTVQQLAETALERGVSIRLPAEPPDVEVNAAVELVLANLVGNAIKYSRLDSTKRWVSVEARVEESSGATGRTLVVTVRDNGQGVALAERERIFERFYRARATAGTVEGSGLGLTIVQDVLASLGGRISAEFPDGGGAAFTFVVPCIVGEVATAQTEHLEMDSAAHASPDLADATMRSDQPGAA